MHLPDVAATLAICIVIVAIAKIKNVFDNSGIMAAFAIGMAIGITGGVHWVLILLIFLFTSFAATKYKFGVKEKMGIQEGIKGERGAVNVIATGAVPAIVAVMHGLLFLSHDVGIILYLTAVAVPAADTMASELGMLSDRTYLITNFKPVRPGTNGGISLYGEAWAAIASSYVAVIGWLFINVIGKGTIPFRAYALVATMGFVGCQVDSILGATVEQRGMIGKHSVNLLSASTTIIITWVILWAYL